MRLPNLSFIRAFKEVFKVSFKEDIQMFVKVPLTNEASLKQFNCFFEINCKARNVLKVQYLLFNNLASQFNFKWKMSKVYQLGVVFYLRNKCHNHFLSMERMMTSYSVIFIEH